MSHGSNIWHEYRNHSNPNIEAGRHQIANTASDIKEAIEAIYHPDVVEALFTKSINVNQQQSFAYAKKSSNGHYVVVEAVGGKRNPNVVPVMILQFDEKKWNDMIANGMVLGQLLYENDPEKLSELDVSSIKKNRVTVAQFASKKPLLNTPRSPQFNSILPQNHPVVNTSDENSSPSDNSVQSARLSDETPTNRTLLAGALDSVATSEEDRTELRHSILKIAENLDRKLLRPTKEQHVPLNLQKAVAQFKKCYGSVILMGRFLFIKVKG